MPVNVIIGNRDAAPFRIESDNGVLKLPSILVELADPTHGMAAVKAVRVRFQGNPLGLVILGAAYVTTGDLAAFDKPRRLTPRLECQPRTYKLNREEFPAGRYLMRAEVVYELPSPIPGRPGKEATTFVERHLEVPGSLERTCGLRAEWQHRESIIGTRKAAELALHVENLPRGAAPVVAVHDPDSRILPSLRAAINHHLAVSPPALLRAPTGPHPAVFLQRFDFPFEVADAEKNRAIEKAPIRIELRVSVLKPGGRGEPDVFASESLTDADRRSLVVDFQENMFPGYPVLDVGTSTTFSLVYCHQRKVGTLPVEQEQTARAQLMRWLDRTDSPFGTPEWKEVLASTARELGDTGRGGSDPAAWVRGYLKRFPPYPFEIDSGLHRMLRSLELSALATTLPVPFRLAVRRELAGMYTRVFGRVPENEQMLDAVAFEPGSGGEAELEGGTVAPIPSTVAVKSLDPFAVEIGRPADAARRAAGAADPGSLLTEFHSSPKIYYRLLGRGGESLDVSVGKSRGAVSPRTFLVASLRRLRERIEAFRDSQKHLPRKRFSKIVLPFPTSAPLSVRQELLEVVREAGFDNPVAELDEALSAIVFYLVKPFGFDLELGLEAFRAGCRPIPRGDLPPTEWRQTVLLIDVGGGTTDIALIEVRLEDVQAKGAGDGSLGRYYRLTPKLLGATGKDQLAGNVLSLGIFHVVKRRVADTVISAVAPKLASAEPAPAVSPPPGPNPTQAARDAAALDRLARVAADVPRAFRDKAGARYRPGSLTEHYPVHQLWHEGDDPAGPAAFRFANVVLPTAWQGLEDPAACSAAARSFHLLWRIAEDIKINVFGGGAVSATVTPDQIAELLNVSPVACRHLGLAPVVISRDEFEAAVDRPLRQIAQLALELTASSLPRPDDGPGLLDRVVLTGQTCRLGRVREVIGEVFRKDARIRWDPACLTFEGEYAKQAAALGAAYAQRLREDRVHPNADKTLNGNVFTVDIDNLFFFLQSGFFLKRDGAAIEKEVLLSPGQDFREFDADGVGRLRSAWTIHPTETLRFHRFDFASDEGVPWGYFDCRRLATQLGVSWEEFQEHVRVAIEADHRLLVSVLFCWGEGRHYELPARGPRIDVPEALQGLGLLAPPPPPPRPGEPAAPPRLPEAWLDAVAGWVIGVNVHGGFGDDNLFRLGPGVFNLTLHHPADGSTRRGAESAELPPCPESGTDKFFMRPVDGRLGWTQIGELERPKPVAGRRIAPRAFLDDHGNLRVVPSEVPLFYARTDKDLLTPGVVLRKSLTSLPPMPDELRDPFCGRH